MAQVKLAFPEWPSADQALWRQLTTRGNPLDPGGELAHLRPTSLANLAVGYGRWLFWLQLNIPDALSDPPLFRITAPRVAGWVQSLADLAPYSRKMFIDALINVVSAADRHACPIFLRRYQSQLLRQGQTDSGQRKVGRIPCSIDLVNAGLDYADVGVGSAKSAFERARRLRDAAMIVVLAMVPIRCSNFVNLELGRTMIVSDDHIVVHLPAADTKNHRPFEMTVPDPAAVLLRRYLEEARPILLDRSKTPGSFLWLADTGKPYKPGYAAERVRLLTEKLVGVRASPHFFRDAVATTFARSSPDLARGTRAILGHTDFRTSERHYNHAQAIEAGRSYAEVLKAAVPDKPKRGSLRQTGAAVSD